MISGRYIGIVGVFSWLALARFVCAQEAVVSRIKLSGDLAGGITANPANPRDRQNFGRLFTDRSNEPMLNQFVLTLERALDSEQNDVDWGFRLQGLVGSDARFTHSTGLFDLTLSNIVQPDLVEAYLSLHLPVVAEGGIDLKLGKFAALQGAEVIPATGNFFYSHSYIFNFGGPFNHTGLLAIAHLHEKVDVYGGLTRGVNVTFDDNNSSLGFTGGVGMSCYHDKMTLMVSTSIGSETPHSNNAFRCLNDITVVWKISARLTTMLDLNYAYDDGLEAHGYGVAQYFVFAINDWLSAGVRGEVWRDAEGFYVAQFATNSDFEHALRGDDFVPDPRTVGGGITTYGALTVGVNVKPPVPHPLAGLVLRPEVRYDRSLNGTHPFNDSSDIDQFTFALDAVISF